MELNHQQQIVKAASIDFLKFILDFEEKHEALTDLELLAILHEYEQHIIKRAIKAERGVFDDELRDLERRRQADGD